jgi:hypothetical protein
MELHPLGSELFDACAQKQADVLKPIVALRNFANATKKGHPHPNHTLPLGLVQNLSSPPFQWF